MVGPRRVSLARALMQINEFIVAELMIAALRNGRRTAMIRLIAVAFALTLASSALAMPRAPLQEPVDIVIKVRQACGAGMHYVNGACIRTPARRAASRCARGVTC
jgi:hypothetical protein